MKNQSKFTIWAAIAAAISLQTASFAEAEPQQECYILREWNGKIALMQEGNDEPLIVYETPLSSLYPADAELLAEGIRVKSRAEIVKLIEDLDLE